MKSSSNLKILVTTQDIVSPIRGGGGLRTRKTAREFARRGNEVIMLAPSDKNIIEDIHVEPLPQLSKEKSQMISSLYFMFDLTFKLFKSCRNVDVIFAHNSIAGIPSVVFGKIFGKKIVLDITDVHTEYLIVPQKSFLNKLILLIAMKIEYMGFKLADKVIVVSNVMKDLLIEKGVNPNKIFVVYDGVEVENFSMQKEEKNHHVIIHHGGVDPQDGVEYIAEAAPVILKEYPSTRFYVLGSGTCLEDVKKRVDEYGVSDSFVFTGWRPYKEMKNYLSKADIGLITRPNTLPNNLVLTLKLLEYWASGTVVVSSRLTGIEEVSDEGQDILFFEPDNSKDLAEKIVYLFDNSDKFTILRKNGRKKAEVFEWNKLVKEIVDICVN